MSNENTDNKNENENLTDEQKAELVKNEEQKNVQEFLEKYKENDSFKNVIAEMVKNQHSGLLKNRDDLLSEVSKLKEFKNKTNNDEVLKLLSSGSVEDRQKAVDLLTNDAVSKYVTLIEEKDNVINQYKEKEAAYIKKSQEQAITNSFKKSQLFDSIKEEAIEDYILPAIFANFTIKDGNLSYTGKEINKAGKPLNLDEYLVHYLKVEKDRSFFLKEKNGSNTLLKVSDTTTHNKTANSFLDMLNAEGKIKK